MAFYFVLAIRELGKVITQIPQRLMELVQILRMRVLDIQKFFVKRLVHSIAFLKLKISWILSIVNQLIVKKILKVTLNSFLKMLLIIGVSTLISEPLQVAVIICTSIHICGSFFSLYLSEVN